MENKYVDRTVIVMTVFLMFVIFTELAISTDKSTLENPDGTRNELGWIFYVINYFLLLFFVIEIILRLFAWGYAFLKVFINAFDSIIVIVSFVFVAGDITFKFIGLLRILRLIKVMTEMKKIADQAREKKELIKKKKK